MEIQSWSLFYFILHSSYLLPAADQTVFQSEQQAKAIFIRPKRANVFFIEEILKGNLERECIEERCTKEEAREVFEDDEKTEEFWTVYYDGDQCKSNPCQHGGTCKDQIGGYSCKCTDMYSGYNCEKDVSECPSGGLLACEHYCVPLRGSYQCFCARGYNLHSDNRSCIPHAQDLCGNIRDSFNDSMTGRNMNAEDFICPEGKCPWQVTFLDDHGGTICHGVVLGRRSILTTATCMATDKDFFLSIGLSSQLIKASQVAEKTVHKRYLSGDPYDDLAFLALKQPILLDSGTTSLCLPEKDFSENILMKIGKQGVVVGRANKPSYLSLDVCHSKLNLTFPMTNKMFCMEEPESDKCVLASGSPVATVEGNTAFLTGLFLSQTDCSQGLVFTKISRYLPWIRRLLINTEVIQT